LLKLAAIDAVGEYLRPTDKNCTLRRMNRLLGDTALRQGLLDLLQTRVCHLRAGEVERGEMLEVLDLFQTRVCHLGVAEVECGELLEVLDLLQTRVRHLCVAEIECGEMLEVLDLFQARVRHLCEAEVEHFCVSINYSVRAGNRNRLLILRDRQFPWLFPKCGFPQQV